jgi:hypothetical protein
MSTYNKHLIEKARAPAQTHSLLPNIYPAVILPLRNISTIFVKQVRALPLSFPALSPQKGAALSLQHGVQESRGRLELQCSERRGHCPGWPTRTRPGA